MGKGRRLRNERADTRPAYEIPLQQARALERTVRILCIIAVLVLALSLFLPSWSVQIIADNLAAGTYDAEETAALTPILPLGRLSLILTAAGSLITAVLLWLRKVGLSLIGFCTQLVAAAMLIAFAVTVGEVFAYNPILHSGHGQGLTFWDLVLRYYSLLIPVIMQTVAVCMGFAARKKRDVADVMQQAADTSSTLTLDEEESTPDPS